MTFLPQKRGGKWIPRGRDSTPWRKQSQAVELPVGPSLTTIAHADIGFGAEFDKDSALIDSCEYMASYSWKAVKRPTILVPGLRLINVRLQGKPPAWSPPAQTRQLQADHGDYFRDPNAARFPQFPTEPAVQAVLMQNPDHSMNDIDIFACASTLGNLLRFARNIDRPFRFNLELIGNTIFLVRKESSPTALIEDIRGYGHTFPESYTSWEPDVKRSSSHQRIVRYHFGGLNCLVRFGTDGYYKDIAKGGGEDTQKSPSDTGTTMLEDLEELTVSGAGRPATTENGAESLLQAEKAGQPISQDAILEIKTKHGKFPIDMADVYPRLWVTQIRNFVLAYHDRGVFNDVRQQDLHEDVEKWEQDNNESLCRLVVLLHKIISFAKKNPEAKLEVVRKEGGDLEIREQAYLGQDTLTEATKARWLTDVESGSGKVIHSEEEEEEFGDAQDYFEDDDEEPDYTACSADHCGYCGRST
ncbi:hypothetical protein BT63DRAFT_471224 [Microthyrium microscopicum]|uniref:Geranylgeranyl pyrophosphate synthetase n=1 Tax=Microthyrium microscopicum TaxID=703497 RepID=A0A6A6UDL3_9PEZI|nr:hypothetical protein BT63DRAFT_471224 [Microthyrium microscopicum]